MRQNRANEDDEHEESTHTRQDRARRVYYNADANCLPRACSDRLQGSTLPIARDEQMWQGQPDQLLNALWSALMNLENIF